jgi:hypothetical protein
MRIQIPKLYKIDKFNNTMKQKRGWKELLRNNILFLIVLLISIGSIVAGDFIIKGGNIDAAGTGNFSGIVYANGTDLSKFANYQFGSNSFNGSGDFVTSGNLTTSYLCNSTGTCFTLTELNATISSSGDNQSWNESFARGLFAPNTTAGIQYLLNSTGVYSTANDTYQNYITANQSNSTTWWAFVSSFAANYFFKNGNNLDFNETKLNATIDLRNQNFNETGLVNAVNSSLQTQIGRIDAINSTIINSNASWLSTYNATYNNYVNLNKTNYSFFSGTAFNLINSSFIADNSSWNESYANTKYAQYNFTTNNFNGSGNITTSGFCSIGTTNNPRTKLDIYGTENLLTLGDAGMNVNENYTIDFSAGTASVAKIQATAPATGEIDLNFWTYKTSFGSPAERMRITANGSLLIGLKSSTASSSPLLISPTRLEVNGSAKIFGNLTILGNYICNNTNCYSFEQFLNYTTGGTIDYLNIAMSNQTNIFNASQQIIGNVSISNGFLNLSESGITGNSSNPASIIIFSNHSCGTSETGGPFISGISKNPQEFFGISALTGGSSIFWGGIDGEAYRRVRIRSDGRILWGNGTSAPDVYLSRNGTSILKLSSDLSNGKANLIVTGNITSGNLNVTGTITSNNIISNISYGSFYYGNSNVQKSMSEINSTLWRNITNHTSKSFEFVYDDATAKLMAQRSGTYKIDYSVSFTANQLVTMLFAVGVNNEAKESETLSAMYEQVAGNMLNAKAAGILTLNANDNITLMAKTNSGAANISIYADQLNLIRIAG